MPGLRAWKFVATYNSSCQSCRCADDVSQWERSCTHHWQPLPSQRAHLSVSISSS